jgi:flagellar biosynthesis protein FlhF
MRLKLFRAPDMSGAMAQLRAELGGDALILATRLVRGGVEITAAVEPPDPMPAPELGLLDALHFHAVPAGLRAALHAAPLEAALDTAFAFATLPLARGDPPLLLIGPPGAGKTFTAARLATRLVLAGIHPLVIAADGKRAGATEQLAAFTKLLGIELIVAAQPVALGRALARHRGTAPVLIDSPGIDPFDPTQAEQTAAMHAAAAATGALVLPAGLDPAEGAELGAAYAKCGATLLIATRLDLSPRLGGILAAAAAGRLALAEAGIGPGAADGLIPLTRAVLAERLRQIRSPRG